MSLQHDNIIGITKSRKAVGNDVLIRRIQPLVTDVLNHQIIKKVPLLQDHSDWLA